MDRPIGSQGPFDAIIHKMTDHMIEAMDGNLQAQHNMQEIEVGYKLHTVHIIFHL